MLSWALGAPGKNEIASLVQITQDGGGIGTTTNHSRAMPNEGAPATAAIADAAVIATDISAAAVATAATAATDVAASAVDTADDGITVTATAAAASADVTHKTKRHEESPNTILLILRG